MKQFRRALLVTFGGMMATVHGQVTAETPGWFVFDMPALAVAAGGIPDLSGLNPAPISKGFVGIADGHFVDANGARLRLFGTNVTGDSCFPDETVSPRLVRRLRQLGFNCLRLHFMDYSWGGDTRDSLWDDPATGKLSEKSLMKLDRLIAECAANGIYLNLNLHVAREYPGNPGGAGGRSFRFSKNLDRWHDPFIDQMAAFCRDLLNHVNPHTGNRYAEEPAIACVEINNENTMIRDDLTALRELPDSFVSALERKWTEWLRNRYGSTGALRDVWNAEVIPLGEERLTNPDSWGVESAGGARATLTKEGTRLVWTATESGTASWNLQLQYKKLAAEPGRYTLTFRGRSRDSKRIGICVLLDAPPWGRVGLGQAVQLTPEWQIFAVSGDVAAPSEPGPLRLNISLSNETGQVEMEDVSLRPGGGEGLADGQSIEAGITLPGSTVVDAVRMDWMRFLIDTEMATTRRIVRLIKDDIGCRMPVADTQVSYGGVAGVLREATLCDYVDIHGYWEHPQYTRDPKTGRTTGFRIPNTTQVASAGGGTLSRMGVYRVAGRPFSVSEYNTPAPSDYGAELFPLFAAVASLQEWDALYSYTYRDFGKDYENTFIRKYFHLIGRANVLVHAPACALAFRTGLIAAATDGVHCTMSGVRIPRVAHVHQGIPEVWESLGADPAAVWLRKVTVGLTSDDTGPRVTGDLAVGEGTRTSDTGQIRWCPTDPEGAWFSLDAPAVRMLAGHVGGRRFDIGDVNVHVLPRPWARNLPAYACITLAALDGEPVERSRRMLFAASARTENSNQGWNPDRTSLGMDGWGTSPTVSEGVALDLTVPGTPVTARGLDPAGHVGSDLPVENGTLRLRPRHRTLWLVLERP